MDNYKELTIIGGGIAGVSAAVYAKRAGLDFFIFEPQSVGGQLSFIETIDNYVGVKPGISGADFSQTLSDTLKELEVKVNQEEILKVRVEKELINLHSENNLYSSKGLIIASGASFRKLGVDGEKEFLGKGVSYCAICDGFFFKNKDVVVVGGGNSACEEALYLSRIARKVFLVHRRDKLRALDYLKNEIMAKDNIEVIFDNVVKKLEGKEFLEQVVLSNVKTNQTKTLVLNGLFVAIGVIPNTNVFGDIITLDKDGFILIDNSMQTSLGNVWACGDCCKKPLRQLITAASEGAVAALSAYKYLKGHYISS